VSQRRSRRLFRWAFVRSATGPLRLDAIRGRHRRLTGIRRPRFLRRHSPIIERTLSTARRCSGRRAKRQRAATITSTPDDRAPEVRSLLSGAHHRRGIPRPPKFEKRPAAGAAATVPYFEGCLPSRRCAAGRETLRFRAEEAVGLVETRAPERHRSGVVSIVAGQRWRPISTDGPGVQNHLKFGSSTPSSDDPRLEKRSSRVSPGCTHSYIKRAGVSCCPTFPAAPPPRRCFFAARSRVWRDTSTRGLGMIAGDQRPPRPSRRAPRRALPAPPPRSGRSPLRLFVWNRRTTRPTNVAFGLMPAARKQHPLQAPPQRALVRLFPRRSRSVHAAHLTALAPAR